jgi:hypothetical protein
MLTHVQKQGHKCSHAREAMQHAQTRMYTYVHEQVVRRVLEMVVPLTAKPAVKAGLLELRAAGVLSHLVHRLAPRCALCV